MYIDNIRKHQKLSLVTLDEGWDDQKIALGMEIENAVITKIDIINAMNKLPENYLLVAELVLFDGLRVKEVGKVLNLSVPAVKSRLYRAKAILQSILKSGYP